MKIFFLFVLITITLLIGVYLYRVLRGPTVFDRVLGLNGISTKAIILLVVMGGFVVSVESLGFNPAVYLKNTIDFLQPQDVTSGLIKSAVFGFIIALMGCFHGYHSEGGAQGVGRTTTNAVVSASILILTSNYILTQMLFSE